MRSLKKPALLFLFWSGLAVCFIANASLTVSLQGETPQLIYIVPWELASWYLWGLLTPVIVAFIKKFPFGTNHIRNIPIYLLVALVVASVHLVVQVLIVHAFDKFTGNAYGSLNYALTVNFFGRFTWRLMMFVIIVIAANALEAQKRFREEQKRASDLKLELVNAQLTALKMQLQPHFLFNTLNSISELMHQNIKLADEMMVRLGDFLRLTLENTGKQSVTLAKELEFLQSYLRIEEIRFQDRLSVVLEIPEETKLALVPNLILQPIVENAIRHGITERSDPGKIEIVAKKYNSMLQIRISDNGQGLKDSQTPGVGISNTRNRLKQMYGDRYGLELANGKSRGVVVTLEVPFEI
jgi:two-component system LytT family sensor kinase